MKTKKFNNEKWNIFYLAIFLILLFIGLYIYIYYEKTKDTFYNENNNENNKIAFLFLTYNNLKREDIWNRFFDINDNNISKYANKFTIYNHSKEPEKVTNKLIKHKHIPEHINTCWGCPNLVEANILMLKNALKDKKNKKFILVSGSCIPIVSFNTFYNEVMKDDKSIINIRHNINPERYDKITNPSFKKDEFTKHSGSGLILNIKHAKLLVLHDVDDLKKNWKNVFASDEHYFGNILRVLDTNFNINHKVTDPKPTFDIWKKNELNKTNLNDTDIITDSYINISKITNKAIDEIRDKKFLLIRKVNEKTEIDINYILSY